MGHDGQPASPEDQHSVVVIDYPGGREFLWLSDRSPIAAWQIGDAVRFRNSPWRVVERIAKVGSLTLTLRR